MSDLMIHTFNHQNAESAQLIFGDLLETEPQLLADLMLHANSSDAIGLLLCEILSEGFKRLINDTIENPSILAKNYLDEVEEYIYGLFIEFCLISVDFLLLLLQNHHPHTQSSCHTTFLILYR